MTSGFLASCAIGEVELSCDAKFVKFSSLFLGAHRQLVILQGAITVETSVSPQRVHSGDDGFFFINGNIYLLCHRSVCHRRLFPVCITSIDSLHWVLFQVCLMLRICIVWFKMAVDHYLLGLNASAQSSLSGTCFETISVAVFRV